MSNDSDEDTGEVAGAPGGKRPRRHPLFLFGLSLFAGAVVLASSFMISDAMIKISDAMIKSAEIQAEAQTLALCPG